MATNHSIQIAQFLRGNNLHVSDDNIKAYPVDDEPIQAVFIQSTGGTSTPYSLGSTEEWKKPTSQVRIRVPPKKYMEGQEDANDIYDLLSLAQPSGYVVWRTINGQPLEMGQDDDGNFNWSINVQTEIIE